MNDLENLVKSLGKVHVRLCQDSFVLIIDECHIACSDMNHVSAHVKMLARIAQVSLAWILQRFMQDLFKI